MYWQEGDLFFLALSHCRSLLNDLLLSAHVAVMALAHSAVHLSLTISGSGETRSLTSIAGLSHHVFSKRASLLDGRFKVLVRLFLDSLCIL